MAPPVHNVCRKLLQRETFCHRPGAGVNRVRSFCDSLIPNASVLQADAPDAHICRFSPDGQYLVCFGAAFTTLVVYRFKGLSRSERTAALDAVQIGSTASEGPGAAGAGSGSRAHGHAGATAATAARPSASHGILHAPHAVPQPGTASFNTFFELLYRVPIVRSAGAALCKDFALFPTCPPPLPGMPQLRSHPTAAAAAAGAQCPPAASGIDSTGAPSSPRLTQGLDDCARPSVASPAVSQAALGGGTSLVILASHTAPIMPGEPPRPGGPGVQHAAGAGTFEQRVNSSTDLAAMAAAAEAGAGGRGGSQSSAAGAGNTGPSIVAAARPELAALPYVEQTMLHLVRLEDGAVLDTMTWEGDWVPLAGHAGVSMFGDLLAVTAVRSQAIHMVSVVRSCSLVRVGVVGTECAPDDALVLRHAADAEDRFQRQQATLAHARAQAASTNYLSASPHPPSSCPASQELNGSCAGCECCQGPFGFPGPLGSEGGPFGSSSSAIRVGGRKRAAPDAHEPTAHRLAPGLRRSINGSYPAAGSNLNPANRRPAAGGAGLLGAPPLNPQVQTHDEARGQAGREGEVGTGVPGVQGAPGPGRALRRSLELVPPSFQPAVGSHGGTGMGSGPGSGSGPHQQGPHARPARLSLSGMGMPSRPRQHPSSHQLETLGAVPEGGPLGAGGGGQGEAGGAAAGMQGQAQVAGGFRPGHLLGQGVMAVDDEAAAGELGAGSQEHQIAGLRQRLLAFAFQTAVASGRAAAAAVVDPSSSGSSGTGGTGSSKAVGQPPQGVGHGAAGGQNVASGGVGMVQGGAAGAVSAAVRRARRVAKQQELRAFYARFDALSRLVVWRAQLVSRDLLLLDLGCVACQGLSGLGGSSQGAGGSMDGGGSGSASATGPQQSLYIALYDWRTTKVRAFVTAGSDAGLALLAHYADALGSDAAGCSGCNRCSPCAWSRYAGGPSSAHVTTARELILGVLQESGTAARAAWATNATNAATAAPTMSTRRPGSSHNPCACSTCADGHTHPHPSNRVAGQPQPASQLQLVSQLCRRGRTDGAALFSCPLSSTERYALVKRVFALLPGGSQLLSTSPLVDATLFTYDASKLAPFVSRPRPCVDTAPRLYPLAAPHRAPLRLEVGSVDGAQLRGRKALLALFHPVVPFVMCVVSAVNGPQVSMSIHYRD